MPKPVMVWGIAVCYVFTLLLAQHKQGYYFVFIKSRYTNAQEGTLKHSFQHHNTCQTKEQNRKSKKRYMGENAKKKKMG